MTALSLIIADDHQLVRAGLSQLIEAQPDLRVTAQCKNGKEALAALKAQSCQVLLLDLSLPDMSGLDVLKFTRQHYPGTAVLVLSGFPERQFGINVLRAGASGFVSKSVDEAELLRAVRTGARPSREDLADYDQLVGEWGVAPALATRIAPELMRART